MKSRFSKEYLQKLEFASPTRLAWYRLTRRKEAMVALVIVCIFFILAFISLINFANIADRASAQPENIMSEQYKPIFDSLKYPFGTDVLGRNVFLRAIVATKISIFLGIFTCLMYIPISLFMGAVAGYFGRWVDNLVVYLMSLIVAIPGLLIILSIVRILGASYVTISITIALTGWVGLARVVRGKVLQIKESEYVLAARNLGASDARIIWFHIIPNLVSYILVSIVLSFVSIIRTEVFLAYVGLSIIGVPTWGTMISESKSEVFVGNWQSLGSAAIFMLIFLLSLNILGDALNDVFDPKFENR